MNRIKKISICATLVVCMIVSMCPTSYAVDYSVDTDIFSVDVSRPSVDNNHVYLELLQRMYVAELGTYGYFSTVYVVSSKEWINNSTEERNETVTPMFTLDVKQNGTLTIHSRGDVYNYYVGLLSEYRANSSAYYYNNGYGNFMFSIPTGYEIVGFHAYGFDDVTSDLSSQQEFTVLYDDEAAIFHKVSDLYLLISSFEQYLEIDTDYLYGIMNSNADIVSKLSDLLSFAQQYLDILQEMSDDVDTIKNLLNSVEGYLYNLEYLGWQYFPYIEMIYWEQLSINEKLDKILEALNMEGESDLTSPDTSNNDKYYDMEQSLLDNSGVDVNNAVQVEIDQNALVVIWDMVEDLYNTHPQVFGLVITVLSLSIIALILGRGKS